MLPCVGCVQATNRLWRVFVCDPNSVYLLWKFGCCGTMIKSISNGCIVGDEGKDSISVSFMTRYSGLNVHVLWCNIDYCVIKCGKIVCYNDYYIFPTLICCYSKCRLECEVDIHNNSCAVLLKRTLSPSNCLTSSCTPTIAHSLWWANTDGQILLTEEDISSLFI